MGALTETEKQKLSEWSATEVMGWVTDRYTLNLSYHNVAEGGIASGQNEVIATVNWRPWESLAQAVMVADILVMDWRLGREDCLRGRYWARTGPCKSGVSLTRVYAEADNPAEALLVAAARACGVEGV